MFGYVYHTSEVFITIIFFFFFFFQAEDGIRDPLVTGVQTCALPIWVISSPTELFALAHLSARAKSSVGEEITLVSSFSAILRSRTPRQKAMQTEIGRASCRERV